MKALHCAIKKQYLDLIKAGTKTVEYRDMSEYWVNKLCDVPENKDIEEYRTSIIKGDIEPKYKPYTHIVFHCKDDVYTLPITEIKTYKGHKIFAIGLDMGKNKGFAKTKK